MAFFERFRNQPDKEQQTSIFENLKCFSVSASEDFPDKQYYDFCINNQREFQANPKDAYPLYSRLLEHCPDFFSPVPYTQPLNLSCGVLSISEGNVTIQSLTLFRKWKVKATIPVRDIKSCYQVYFDDSEVHWDQLVLLMRDGTKYAITTRSMATSFYIARILKSLNPDLEYCFPLNLDLHDSLTKHIY